MPSSLRYLPVLLAAACHALPTQVVDLRGATPPQTLAAQVCVGLLNRDPSLRGAAYALLHPEDVTWLALVGDEQPPTALDTFMHACLAGGGVAGSRIIRYNFSAQQEVVPNLLTIAAVLDAVPLEAGSPWEPPGAALVFDAVAAWVGFHEVNATAFVFDHYGNATSGVAKMNPGWDVHGAEPLSPPLSKLPDLSLADFIVKAKYFNFFLLNGCIPGTAEYALLERMTADGASPWPRPIGVMGYDDSWAIAGDVWEAETACGRHNAGQIASVGVSNLAYFSREPPVTQPLTRPPLPLVPYNASLTYVALVVGDGDNVAYVKGTRQQWMAARVAACAPPAPPCAPLAWTLSPALATLAPAILRWFHASSLATAGADAFVLPPSGHLYAYPSLMSARDQAAFVAATAADAALLNTRASVAWEVEGTWEAAIGSYFPRYAGGQLRAMFAVNVPYLLPAAAWGNASVLLVAGAGGGAPLARFAPREWRGTSAAPDPLDEPFFLSVAQQAAALGALPRGSVTAIYGTSDGGLDWQDLAALAGALPPHVRVVAAEQIGELAREAAAAGSPSARAIEG